MKSDASTLAVSPVLRVKTEGNDKRQRIWEVDVLRGLFFIFVFLYHLTWDISMIPSVFSNYYDASSESLRSLVKFCDSILYLPNIDVGVDIVAGAFLVLTGVCCALSHDNLLRGLKIFSWGEVLTLVTLLIVLIGQTNELIVFGILHCIGFTVLLYGLYQRLERKLKFDTNPLVFIGLGLLICILGYMFIYGLHSREAQYGNLIGFGKMNMKNIIGIVVGTKSTYGDTFSLFPNAGKILIGIGLGKLLYGKRRGKKSLCPKADGWWFRPVEFVGRHSLLLYLAEQALAWVVIVAVLLPMGFTPGF